MKNIFKTFLIVFIVFGITSCEESDLAIDTLYEEVDTTGSLLRTLEFPADLVNLSGGGVPNSVDFTFEVQEGDGSSAPDFKEVRYYMSLYKDQDLIDPVLDEDGNELGERLIITYSASEFDEISDINGLPMKSISVPTQDILDVYFPEAVVTPPSFIISRFELEMNDGRVWSDYNAGATLTGAFMESPFFYKTIFLPL